MSSYDLDNDVSVEQQVHNLKQSEQAYRKTAEQASKLADAVQGVGQSLAQSLVLLDEIPDRIKEWTIGTERLSGLIGHINDQVVNHGKHMTQIRQDWSKMSSVGKQWLSAINFDSVYKRANKSLIQHRGIFLSSYQAMTRVQMGLAKNMSNLGSDTFQPMTEGLKQLDEQIKKSSDKIRYMMTSDDAAQMQKQYIAITSEVHRLAQLKNKIYNSDKINYLELNKTTLALEDNKKIVQDIEDKLVNQILMSETHLRGAKTQLKILKEQRDHAQALNKAQITANALLKGHFEKMDAVFAKLDQAKDSIAGMFSSIGLEIPFLQDALNSFSFDKIGESIKTSTSEMVTGMMLGFKIIKGDGQVKFKGLMKGIGQGWTGLVGGITSLFKKLFKFVAITGLAVIGGLIGAAMARKNQAEQSMISAQQSAGALSGAGQPNFGKLWGLMGGLHGGEKVAQLYNTMNQLKDVTQGTARSIQTMQRSYGVTAGTSSAVLQNMRYMYGMSQKTSNQFSEQVAHMATLNGLLPQKIMQDIANLSGDVAKHFGHSAEKMVNSVFFAKKLNLTIQDMARTAEGLSDIQGTIQKSLQTAALTGKQIDVGQLIRLNESGETDKALAMMIDTYGNGFDQMTFRQKQSIADLSGLSVDQFSKASNSVLKSGKTATQALQQMNKQASDVVDSMGDGLGKAATKAYPLYTRLQGLNQQIKDIIAKHFDRVVQKIMDMLPTIVRLVDKFVGAMSKLTITALQWIESNEEKIVKFFKDAWQFGVKLVQFVFIPLINVAKKFIEILMKAYQKGGIVGLLGVFAATTVLLKLPTVIMSISKAASGIKTAVKWFGSLGKAASQTTKSVTTASSAIKKAASYGYLDKRGSLHAGGTGDFTKKGSMDALMKQNKDGSYNWLKGAGKRGKVSSADVAAVKAGEYKIPGAEGVAGGAGDISKSAEGINQTNKAAKGSGVAAKGLNDLANAVLKFALAVGVLAGSLWIVSQVAADGNLWESVLAMGGLTLMVVGLAAATKLLGPQSATNVLALSGAVAILAGSLYILSGIPMAKLWNGVAILSVLGGVFVLLGTVGTSSSIGLLALAGAVGILSLSLYIISGIPMSTLWNAVAVLTVLGVVFVTLGLAGTYAGPGLMILAGAVAVLAGGFLIMSVALLILSRLNLGEIAEDFVDFTITMIKSGFKIAALALLAPSMVAFGAAATVMGLGLIYLGGGALLIVSAFDKLVASLRTVTELFSNKGLDKEMVKSLGQSMVIFGELVGKAIFTIYTEMKDMGIWAITKVMVVIKSFNELTGALKSLYQIAKESGAIDSITQGLTALSESDIGTKIGQMMRNIVLGFTGEEKKLKGTGKNMRKSLDSIIGGFHNLVKALVDVSKISGEQMVTIIKNLDKLTLSGVGVKIGELINTIVDSFSKKSANKDIAESTNAMLQSFSKFTDGLIKMKDIASPETIKSIEESITKLPTMGVKVMETMKGIFSELGKIWKGSNFGTKEQFETKNTAYQGVNIMLDGFTRLVDSLVKLKDLSSKAIKGITAAITTIEEGGVGKKISSLMSSLAEGLRDTTWTDNTTKVVDGFSTLVGALQTFSKITGKIDKIQTAASKLDGDGGVFSTIGSALSSFHTKLSLVDTTIITSAVDVFDKLIGVLQKQMKPFNDKVTNSITKFIDDVGSRPDKLSTIKQMPFALVPYSLIKPIPEKVIDSFSNFAKSLDKLSGALIKINGLNIKSLTDLFKQFRLTAQAEAVSAVVGADNSQLKVISKIIGKNSYASGGIVGGPQIALIGQEGPQAIVPLSKSAYAGMDSSSLTTKERQRRVERTNDRPIQLVVNLDGKKMAEQLVTHTNASLNGA